MRFMTKQANRTEKLDIRLTPKAKRTLQAAAIAERRKVSEFVLESALARAEETLADRQRFGLDAERWTAFLEALDAPPRDLPRVRRLFEEPSPFESGSDLRSSAQEGGAASK
jgi:uncharacterized protein (DUF1778 family)